MKRHAPFVLAAVLAMAWLSGAATLRANLTVALSSTAQIAAYGQELVFSGTLTNTSATDEIFLNDNQFALSGTAATFVLPDTIAFFANVPGILLPGETYTGEIFGMTLSSTASPTPTPGGYTGAVALVGGTNIFATGTFSSPAFTVILPGANNIAASSATLNEGVTPAGVDTTVSFQYGTTTGYGLMTSGTDIGAGTGTVFVMTNLAGLQPSTTYHYRMVTVTSSGTTYSADNTFTTGVGIPATPPYAWALLAMLLLIVASRFLPARLRQS